MLDCVLQCVAVLCVVWCSVLQCGAVCCSMLQCVAVCCNVLQCVAVDLMGQPILHLLIHICNKSCTGSLTFVATKPYNYVRNRDMLEQFPHTTV